MPTRNHAAITIANFPAAISKSKVPRFALSATLDKATKTIHVSDIKAAS